MADVDKEYRCGYCYKEYTYMTDAKQLPCQHVFCLECLQREGRMNNNICCPSCQKVHVFENLNGLPAAVLTANIPNTPSSACDCPSCDGQIAESYCVDCAMKFCDNHQQKHSSVFGSRHQQIHISTYELSARKYDRVLCDHHKEPLTRACTKCDLLACTECDMYEDNCTEDRQHRFRSLTKLRDELTSHFNSLLQRASDKLTEICRLDKDIWKVLDEGEVECEERIQQIDEIRDEQMKLIKEGSERVKEEIKEYQRRLSKQVESHNSQLMAKKEQLEEARNKVHRWLRDSHVTEQLQQKQQMEEELLNNTDIELQCELVKTPLIIANQLPSMANVIHCPTSITLKSEHGIGHPCLSASYKTDGDLLLGCWDGLRIFTPGNSMTKQSTDLEKLACVIEHRPRIMVCRRPSNKWIVELCSRDLESREELFSIAGTNTEAPMATLNETYIIATNPGDNRSLVVYEFLTKRTAIIHIEMPPFDVHFIPDGHLLVVSAVSGTLTKYKIESALLSIVWTCSGLGTAGRVCTDSDGLIYVFRTHRQGTVDLVSPDGRKLGEINCDQLPSARGKISIKGRDEVAVPTWRGSSVCLFQINR